MTKRDRAERDRRARRARVGTWQIVAIVALAVAVVAGLIWLGESRPQPAQVAVATTGNIKGDPAAPVTVEEWGDFQ